MTRAVCLAFALAACSTSETSPAPAGGDGDAGGDTDTDAAVVEPGRDAGAEASPSSACEGACKTTALEADFGGVKRALDRAQLGVEPGDGGVVRLHVEAHAGGDAACPTQTSPTPDRTIVIAGVARGAAGRTFTQADGARGAFFDFAGDLGLPPLTRSTAMKITVVAEDVATPPGWVAFDVDATFPDGTVKGHLYATYCASLSE
ncbi:MAG: hypothetical protein KF850_32830 [Labilithrix sp.]|nr:hypothetical protein [Labilithrix sp.]